VKKELKKASEKRIAIVAKDAKGDTKNNHEIPEEEARALKKDALKNKERAEKDAEKAKKALHEAKDESQK